MVDKERKAIIKNSDMTEDMQQDAINVATKAIDSYNIEKDIACYIKKEFDRKHNPTWHCIVGRNFGSYVTHETKHFYLFLFRTNCSSSFQIGINENGQFIIVFYSHLIYL